MAVKWDENWNIDVKYQEPKRYPKADITQVKIAGQTVSNGGSITVTNTTISVEVTVKNVGDADGYIYCAVGGTGVTVQSKYSWVYRGGVAKFTFSVTIPKEGTTLYIKAGHQE